MNVRACWEGNVFMLSSVRGVCTMTVTERTIVIGGVEATVENKDGSPVDAYVDEYEKHPFFETDEYSVELEAGASYEVVDARAVRFTLDDVAYADGISFNETIDKHRCRFDKHYYITEISEPADDEKTVTVNGENVLVKAVDGELTAEVIEDDFVEYVEDIVERGNVVSTRETSGDHDAVIVSSSSHGDMCVMRWIDTLVNDGGVEVGYVGTVREDEDGEPIYDVYEDEWIGRAMICVGDVRDE